jgi:choline dehydrogenase-like flavoprotein
MVTKHEKVDALIIGAGAAGSVYAAMLAEAGKNVLVLEKGPPRKMTELYSSQIWARRLKWSTPHIFDDGENSIWHNLNSGQGYGGTAIHHFGIWPRMHPEDFKLQSLYGKGQDWPLEYDELRPLYDQVQEEVGMSGDAEKEIWRPPGTPYPLPPLLVSEQGERLAKGFAALGMHTSPVPAAILSRPYKGRPACIWDGWCDAGCPTGALANPLAVYFPRAIKAGAKLQAESHVTRILTDKKGGSVSGVEYIDAKGEVHIQLADTVILTAFTVQNSRILLNSANDAQPKGLANSSDLIGRYLMIHPAASVFGMFDDDIQNYLGVTGGTLLNQDRFEKTQHKEGFGSWQWEIAQALKPNDLLGIAMSRIDLFGNDFKKFMKKASKSLGSMAVVCEDQPMLENRIEMTDKKDKHGMPLARVVYKNSPDGRKLWEQATKESLEIFRQAGAKESWHTPPVGHHIMGGTIMGSDPAKSVANKYSQSHDLPNLFIGGPSLNPSTSCVNPTFTAHALAMKSANYLIKNWSAIT